MVVVRVLLGLSLLLAGCHNGPSTVPSGPPSTGPTSAAATAASSPTTAASPARTCPQPPAAAPAPLPWNAGYLEPARTIKLASPSHCRLDDGVIDLQDSATVAHRPGPSGALVRSVLPTMVPPRHYLHVDGLLLGIPRSTGTNYLFRAIDARDGSVRWEQPSRSGIPNVHEAARAGGVVVEYVEYDYGQQPDELVALDRATGQVRWRRPQKPRTVHHLVGTAEQVIVLQHNGELTALSSTDGSVLWRDTKVPSPREDWRDRVDIAAAGGRLFVGVSRRALRVLDAATGTERHQQPIEDGVNGVAASGDTGYAILRDAGTDQLSVVAIDLDCGGRRWQTQVPTAEFRGDGPLTVGADGIYGCGGWGRLFALHRTSGAPAWRYDLARCDPRFAPVVLPSVGARPESLLVRAEGDSELLLFEPGAALVQPLAVTIQGQVRAEGKPPQEGFTVTAGGAKGTTDKRGRYQITTQARGMLWVLVTGKPALGGDFHCPDVNLRLAGRQRHTVNVQCKRVYRH